MTIADLKNEVRALALNVLDKNRTELDELGLQATVKFKPWTPNSTDSLEISVEFTQRGKLFDFFESLVISQGELVCPVNELGLWFDDMVKDVVAG